MVKEIHPVVELMLKRMESHPEEFTIRLRHDAYTDEGNRWHTVLAQLGNYLNDDERDALKAKERELAMGQLHEEAMDELLNGEDRRRDERARAEAEKLIYQQAYAQATPVQQAGQAGQSMLNALAQNQKATRQQNYQKLQNIALKGVKTK